jgi:hypothetical protein
MIILKPYLNLAIDYSLEYSYISSQRALLCVRLFGYDPRTTLLRVRGMQSGAAGLRFDIASYRLCIDSRTQSIFASQNLICLIARMHCCRIQQYLTLKEV